MEILALHSSPSDPQMYPSCAQLNVKGGQGKTPSDSDIINIPGLYDGFKFPDIWSDGFSGLNIAGAGVVNWAAAGSSGDSGSKGSDSGDNSSSDASSASSSSQDAQPTGTNTDTNTSSSNQGQSCRKNRRRRSIGTSLERHARKRSHGHSRLDRNAFVL